PQIAQHSLHIVKREILGQCRNRMLKAAVAMLEVQFDIAAMSPYTQRDKFSLAYMRAEVGTDFSKALLQWAGGHANLVQNPLQRSYFDEIQGCLQDALHLGAE